MIGKGNKILLYELQEREIIQYTKNLNIVRVWKSSSYASMKLGIDRSNIIACCRGRINTYKGFIWKYRES